MLKAQTILHMRTPNVPGVCQHDTDYLFRGHTCLLCGAVPDAPDWKRICEEQQARPYWARNVLHMPPNVSHGKPWYAKVDWDGVGIVFLLFLLCVLCATVEVR